MAVATWQDVAVALGRPTSEFDTDEQAQITYWLDSVELLIGARLGDVTALNQANLKYVEVEAVAARMQNPNGYQSETIDDYTYRFDSSSRRISILDEWWNLLDPGSNSGAFSTRPGFEPDTSPYAWPAGFWPLP